MARYVSSLSLLSSLPSPSPDPPFPPPQIEQWCERHYPSFVRLQTVSGSGGIQLDPYDARTKVAEAAQARDRELAHEKRVAEFRARTPADVRDAPNSDAPGIGEMLMYVGTAFILVLALSIGAAWLMMQWYDLKFKD